MNVSKNLWIFIEFAFARVNKAHEVCKTAKSEFEKHGICACLSTLHFAFCKESPYIFHYNSLYFYTFLIVAGHRKQYAWSRGIQEKCRRNSEFFGH
jgi:hypothetical protein